MGISLTGIVDGRSTALAMAIIVLSAAGCGKAPTTSSPGTLPRIEELSVAPVQIQIIAEPPRPCFDRDFLLTIRSTTPTGLVVRLPSLDDRLQGFSIEGSYDREPVIRDNQIIRDRCLRLRPLLTAEHRLAPMAVQVTDLRSKPPAFDWVATRPVIFETAPVVEHSSEAVLGKLRGPAWIAPTWKTWAFWLTGGALVAGLIVLLIKFARRVHREIQLRRLSPKERALWELKELLNLHLIEKEQVKEFYFHLTMIVRRYIERAHAIRAPEQTTEEFLEAVSRDPQFTREVILRLRSFLQAADLVKYAAFQPDSPAIDQATRTARDYIETDAEAAVTSGEERHVQVR